MSQMSEAPSAHPVLVENSDGVCRIILNRPAKLNALTEQLLLGLAKALDGAAADDAVRVVVLSGAGKAFCAGQDLSDRDPRQHPEPFDLEAIQKRLFHPVVTRMRDMDKPVVAIVAGVAAGAGAGIALAADIVLAAQSARFIQSFSQVGLSVDAGSGYALVKALGAARARGLLMTGGALTGEEAARAGLIWKSVPDEDLDREAEELLAGLKDGPTRAYRAIKRAVAAAEQADFSRYLKQEAALQGEVGRSRDYREGVLSFLEKRQAIFEGR